MRNTIRYVALCVSVFVASATFAQTTNGSPAGMDDDTILLKQVGSSELPDGVAFRIFLDMIEVSSEGDHPVAAEYLRKGMGISTDRAESLVSALLTAQTKLTNELAQSRREILCSAPPNSRTDDELYRLFGMLSELSDATTETHLILFKSRIQGEEAARFQQLLQISKDRMSMGRARPDYKKLYEKRGSDPNAAVADICAALNGT